MSKNEKLSCCCDSRSYCVRRTVYWQTIKPVSITSLRTAGTHHPIQRVEFVNVYPNLVYSSMTDQSSRSQWITERYTTSARLILYLKNSR